ncbi:hypothetical protein [Streptomyces sp. NPDC050704]|uniref:hypothetical protein n=1 Tax=Streptomyces sp. NPDC050704 TaxID=3157219 RepID=UPI00341C336A
MNASGASGDLRADNPEPYEAGSPFPSGRPGAGPVLAPHDGPEPRTERPCRYGVLTGGRAGLHRPQPVDRLGF